MHACESDKKQEPEIIRFVGVSHVTLLSLKWIHQAFMQWPDSASTSRGYTNDLPCSTQQMSLHLNNSDDSGVCKTTLKNPNPKKKNEAITSCVFVCESSRLNISICATMSCMHLPYAQIPSSLLSFFFLIRRKTKI